MSYSKQNFRSGDTLYASQLNAMDDEIAVLEAEVESTKNMVGSPLTASTAAGMTDQTKIYVYTGSETGYTAGHWYYHNGTAWTDGGVYNSVAVNTDTSLAVSGQAADSKAVGDAIDDLDSDLSDLKGSLTNCENILDNYVGYVDGKNKYNPSTITAGTIINNTTGASSSMSGREVTDYISAEVGKKLTVTENYILNGVAVQNLKNPIYVTYYDSNKAFMTGGTFNTQNTEIASGVAYIRVSLVTLEQGRNYQLEFTSNGTPTTYEAYQAPTLQVVGDFVTPATEQLLSEIPSEIAEKMSEPAQEGTAGQALITDGNGGRSWATIDVDVDSTLTQAGEAADAKAVGDALQTVVRCDSVESGENSPTAIVFTNTTDSSDLNTTTGAVKSGNKTISDYVDIHTFKRFYSSASTSTKYLSDVYCLYDKNKNFLKGVEGNTSYTFETIDGHNYCIPYDLNTEGAYYIRTSINSGIRTYYCVTEYSIYDCQIKEVAESRTDYDGTERASLSSTLSNSFSEIKDDFTETNARIDAFDSYETVGTAELVFPYKSAQKVKLTAQPSTALGLHGITVADAEHMGTVTLSNVEEVSDYTGKGKKYRITTLGANGNAYRIGGNATGLTVGKTYRICLKVTDPQNDAAGGGHYVQVMCKTSVKSYGHTVSTERVFTATFVATAITHDIYIYPFQTNGLGYTQAIGDEFVIEDWYINEVNGGVDLYTHEAVITESVTGTELQCTLNGAMFVATGTGATVSVAYMQSRLLSVNGIMPDDSGDVTVKSHLQGGTVVCFGDSITNKGYDDYLDYPYLSSLFTGLNTINVGIGGTSMRYRTNYDDWNKVSFAHMADMIVSGDFSDIQTLGNTSGFEMQNRCAQLYPIISSINWDNVDYITIAFGANDFATSTVINYLLNNSDAIDKYTYLGAFRYALNTILATYPHIQFLVLTPVFRFFKVDGNNVTSDDRVFEDINGNIHYYFWGDKLAECAENEYHVPVCDLYRELGINNANYEWFSTDGVHPEWDGIARMGSHVASALMSMF